MEGEEAEVDAEEEGEERQIGSDGVLAEKIAPPADVSADAKGCFGNLDELVLELNDDKTTGMICSLQVEIRREVHGDHFGNAWALIGGGEEADDVQWEEERIPSQNHQPVEP